MNRSAETLPVSAARSMPPAFRRLPAATISAAVLAMVSAKAADALEIDAAFPGGNVLVERIVGDVVHLRPDLRDTTSWWFYWNFRVRGAAGRSLVFRFAGANPIGVRGPAVKVGDSWSWLGSEAVDDREADASFRYDFPPTAAEVQFAFANPYQAGDFRRFIEAQSSTSYQLDRLCATSEGRSVEMLKIPARSQPGRNCVLLTARHHACETMASFVLEGFVDSLLKSGAPATQIRDQTDFLIVPFVDLDGVERGDQGKNRAPHDHWLDYRGKSRYPEVAAIREFVPEWSAGRPLAAIDFHCSYIREAGDAPGSSQRIFFMNSMRASTAEEAARFQAMLVRQQSGPLRYSQRHDLPFGSRWNVAEIAAPSFLGWASQLPGARMACVLEVPYADADGVAVTPKSARLLGRDLAVALDAYLGQWADRSSPKS